MTNVASQYGVAMKPFDGAGFLDWEFRIKTKLAKEDCLEALAAKPEEMTAAVYDKKDLRAKDIIVSWLADGIIGTIRDKTTARGIFGALKATYTATGLSAKLELKRELSKMRFVKGKLTHFFEEFFRKIQELRSAGSFLDDEEIITMLLTAMPRLYQSVTSSIDIFFSQNPAGVTIEFVKNKLLQEEARQIRDRVGNGKENGASEDLVFYSSSRNPSATEQPKNRNKAKFRCYLCKQRGHFRTECPMLKRRGSTSGGPSNRNQFCGECDHNRRVPQQCHEDRKRSQDDGEIAFSINDAASHHDHALQSGRNKIVFVIDSGCTQHLIGPEFEIYLDNVEDVNIELNVAKKQNKIRATKRGTLHVDSCGVNLKLKDVLMCREVTYNLLSVSKAEEEGIDVVFSGGRVEFSKNGLTCLHGARIGNLFVAELFPRKNFVNACADVDLMHRRMGHSHLYAPSSVCEVCLKGKMTRSSFKSLEDEKKPKRVLEVISSDVAGPFTPATHDGYKYYVTFVDHYSRFACVYLLEKKSDVYDKFVEYHAMVTAQHHVRISRFRSDGGGEYSSTKLNEFCKRNGIVQEFSVPRTPEQVGVCERLNRTLLNMSRCLIIESGLGKDMWGEAVRTSNYLINRLSTRSTGGIPAEIWFGRKVALDGIRVFGCRAFSHIPKEDRQGKLSERCKSLVMIGYAANGYRLWNLEERVVTKARSVKFDESRMPAKLPNIHSFRSLPQTRNQKNHRPNELLKPKLLKIQETQPTIKSQRLKTTTVYVVEIVSENRPQGMMTLRPT